MKSKLIITTIIGLALTQSVFADGVAQDVDELQAENAELRSAIADLVEQQRCHGTVHQRLDWSGCTFEWLDLWDSEITPFRENNIQGSDLSFATFRNSNFIYINARGVNLEGARFEGSNLAYSDWTGSVIVTTADALAYGRAETIFINTFCPDGTFIVDSRNGGESCKDHL